MTQSAAIASPATDIARARALMVDGQLRPTMVAHQRILGAMRLLPREAFLPAALAGRAYVDEHVKLGGGRVLLKPLVLARLLQLAAPRAGEAVLLIGAGTGYGAAVLAACGAQVIALEQDAALLAIARRAVAPGSAVTLVEGRLAEGHEAGAPYDLIVVEGAMAAIPPAISKQVAAGGRLVGILGAAPGLATAVVAEPSAGGLGIRAAFDANAPYLPGFEPVKEFRF